MPKVPICLDPFIYNYIIFKREISIEYMNKYCNNCGNKGHVYRNCRHPILSYGIILYEEHDGESKIVMIERKDTIPYIEFLRGKYKTIYNTEYIQLLFNRFSREEKKRISSYDFPYLWNTLWIHTETINKRIKGEYNHSIKMFEQLKKGYRDKDKNLIDICYFIDNTTSSYESNEWELPKGRRASYETNKECAIREVEEETNISNDKFNIINNIIPFTEEYTGINGVRYKHVYYVGKLMDKCKLYIDMDNKDQYTEIRDISLLNETESLQKIRNYNVEKISVIKKFFTFLKTYNNDVTIK